MMRVNATSITRQGFALVATMFLIVLMIAITAQLATATSIESLVTTRRRSTLAHQLAVDSAMLLIADQLNSKSQSALRIMTDLDLTGASRLEIDVGQVAIACDIRDDGAKLNPALWPRDDQKDKLIRKLEGLALSRNLAGTTVRPRPTRPPRLTTPNAGNQGSRYIWFDQLFQDLPAGMLVGWQDDMDNGDDESVWSDVLTLWGSGRVDIRRTTHDILEAALEDIRPGLGSALLAQRSADRSVNFLQGALATLDGDVRQKVAQRVAFDLRRYAITIETGIGGDRRRWYVVAQGGEDLHVLHRSQIRW